MLEEQIGARLVNGEIAQFVQDEQRGVGVWLEFRFETARTFGSRQRVDAINGTGKEHGGALEAGGIAQGRRPMGFTVRMLVPSWS
jgi:hypothetical protein